MERTVLAGFASWLLIASYLGAIVVSNLLVAAYGQPALVLTALVLIPFDLFSRDLLHERWHSSRLAMRMGALVAAGSVLSFALNNSSWRVSIASCVAFGLAATCDTVIYELLSHRSKRYRMTTSNTVSAIVDSVVFPLIAFGGLSWWLSASQAALKVAGGIAWVTAYGIIFSKENE